MLRFIWILCSRHFFVKYSKINTFFFYIFFVFDYILKETSIALIWLLFAVNNTVWIGVGGCGWHNASICVAWRCLIIAISVKGRRWALVWRFIVGNFDWRIFVLFVQWTTLPIATRTGTAQTAPALVMLIVHVLMVGVFVVNDLKV